MAEYNLDTKCVQAGYQPKNGEPRTLPIVQSTTYKYESSEEMAKLFALEASGYFYTRLANPTNDSVAAKICALEGGAAAVLTCSGQAASFFSLFNICSAGDHIVASCAIYGGTYNLLSVTMKRMGIETTFLHPDAGDEEWNAAFRPNTRALFAETLSNPTLVVLDIARFACLAHTHGVPLIVDNTFPTPMNCQPLLHGADIVVHSTSKYMDGHATSIGGAIVDSGNFDWEGGNYPGLTAPDPSYGGVSYTKTFGKAAYITKCVVQLMRDLGSIPAPQNSFLLNMGLETLAVRMERHCANALAVAQFLQQHPKVASVSYPGLPGDRYHALAQRYLPNGSCGVVSFILKGGRAAAGKFQDSVRLAMIATHVADLRTILLHPASTTQSQLSEEELRACGIDEGMIRLSVGIENAGDILADLEQALEKCE